MTRITSLTDLTKLRDELKAKTSARSEKSNPDSIIQVKVAMQPAALHQGPDP